MLYLHHSGFIVKDINYWESRMIFEEKIKEVIDPLQHAKLSLYKNFGSSMIELIQPLNEEAFTWNELKTKSDHFNHFCYCVNDINEMEKFVTLYKLIPILSPIPALLFDNKKVAFYYARNRQVVEFLIES